MKKKNKTANDKNKLRLMWVTSRTLTGQATSKVEKFIQQGDSLSAALAKAM